MGLLKTEQRRRKEGGWMREIVKTGREWRAKKQNRSRRRKKKSEYRELKGGGDEEELSGMWGGCPVQYTHTSS